MKVEKQYTHPGHYVGDKRVPGASTIAGLVDRKDGLVHWAWKLGMEGKDYKKVRDEAADVGHMVHEMIECGIKGREFTTPEWATPEMIDAATTSFGAYQKWLESTSFKLIASEVKLASERHLYGGILDCIAKVQDETSLLDWKTSKGVYPAYICQVSAYRNLWNEKNPNNKIVGCHLLRIDRDTGNYTHYYFSPKHLDTAFRAFLVCRELYDLQKELKRI